MCDTERTTERDDGAVSSAMGASCECGPDAGNATRAPLAEAYVVDDWLVVGMELPGVEKSDVELEATSDGLRVLGERTAPEYLFLGDGVCASELRYGPFGRALAWPQPVNHEAAEAAMDNGMLIVMAPLAERRGRREPRRVPIE